MTLLVLIAAAAFTQGPGQSETVPPGTVEGRPRPEHASPLQARIDVAQPGDRIVVGPGTYEGDLLIDKQLALVGEGTPRLLGSGTDK